jgi:hypothetical protein
LSPVSWIFDMSLSHGTVGAGTPALFGTLGKGSDGPLGTRGGVRA